jgi:peptidyl-Lys metalloendopeptidase
VTDDPAASTLRATIDAPATLPSGERVSLRFTLTNETDARLHVLKWYTPLEGIAGEIFRVTRDGEAIPYRGILAYRAAPLPDDYVLLHARESVSAEVDLTASFDFSKAGEYTIEFVSPLISHVASMETEMAKTLDALGPVHMPSNVVVVEIHNGGGA